MSLNNYPISSVNDLFDSYSAAFELFDAKTLAFHYHLPCYFVTDEAETIFTEESKLEGMFNKAKHFFRKYGIEKMEPEIWNKRALTNLITEVKVIWHYKNAAKETLYSCDYNYVLKLNEQKEQKILTSISINEKLRMETWLKTQNIASKPLKIGN